MKWVGVGCYFVQVFEQSVIIFLWLTLMEYDQNL